MDPLAIVVRPLALLLLLVVAALVAWAVKPLIPAGRIKDALYKKRDLIPPPKDPR